MATGTLSAISASGDNQVYVTDAHGIVQRVDTTALLNHQVQFLPAPDPYKNIAGGH